MAWSQVRLPLCPQRCSLWLTPIPSWSPEVYGSTLLVSIPTAWLYQLVQNLSLLAHTTPPPHNFVSPGTICLLDHCSDLTLHTTMTRTFQNYESTLDNSKIEAAFDGELSTRQQWLCDNLTGISDM